MHIVLGVVPVQHYPEPIYAVESGREYRSTIRLCQGGDPCSSHTLPAGLTAWRTVRVWGPRSGCELEFSRASRVCLWCPKRGFSTRGSRSSGQSDTRGDRGVPCWPGRSGIKSSTVQETKAQVGRVRFGTLARELTVDV